MFFVHSYYIGVAAADNTKNSHDKKNSVKINNTNISANTIATAAPPPTVPSACLQASKSFQQVFVATEADDAFIVALRGV